MKSWWVRRDLNPHLFWRYGSKPYAYANSATHPSNTFKAKRGIVLDYTDGKLLMH